MAQNILVAEDDEQVRSVIRMALESNGYDVCEAANGEEAVRACQTAPFDLVIADILMPEMDGLETIMFLRKEMKDVKIIAISGSENQLFLNNAAGLGATSILPKPFSPAQLLTAVREALSGPSATPS